MPSQCEHPFQRCSQFTLVMASAFFDDVKEWSAPVFDAHQLGVRFNFDIDIKILLSRSKF